MTNAPRPPSPHEQNARPGTPRLVKLLAGAAALIVAVFVGGNALITHLLREHVVQILGPSGHASSIDVGLTRITLRDVVIKATTQWPATDVLRARQIVLMPNLWALLSHRVEIRSADLDQAYLSVVRDKQGKVSLLPTLRTSEKASAEASASATVAAERSMAIGNTANAGSDAATTQLAAKKESMPVQVDKLSFHDSALDFFDETVAGPPFALHFVHLNSTLGPIYFPASDQKTQLALSGQLAAPGASGTERAGNVSVNGWVAFKSQNTDLETHLQNVDVRALQPYLDKHRQLDFESGTASLDIHTIIQSHRLSAKGNVTLDHLVLAHGAGSSETLQSLTREAIITALQDKHGRISLDFSMEGDLSDPRFSVDEDLSTRMATGLAKALGVSAEGVARSLGSTTRGLGGALLNLIGK